VTVAFELPVIWWSIAESETLSGQPARTPAFRLERRRHGGWRSGVPPLPRATVAFELPVI